MIIVEGPDNVGKSTLIKALLEWDPKLRLVQRERFKPGMEGTIGKTYIDMLTPTPGISLTEHSHSIADRGFFSECLYGPLFRGGCRMTQAEHFQIYALLHRLNAVIVWCDAPDDVIMETWQKREQLYDRDPVAIANAYREHMPRLAYELTLFRYDWTRDAQTGLMVDRITKLHHQMLEHFPLIHTCT